MSEPGDVVVINTISIKNNAPAPIIRTNEGLGTHKQVASIAARDLIPTHLRSVGMMCYVETGQITYQLQGGILNTDWVVFVAGGGGSTNEQTDAYIPTIGQTVFILSAVPLDPSDTKFVVNGIRYPFGAPHFTVIGNQVTWLDPFTLDTSDSVLITYFF